MTNMDLKSSVNQDGLISFKYDISIYAFLKREEADFIYSHVIKSSVAWDAESGGKSFTFNNAAFREKDIEDSFSFEQINLFLKALETPLFESYEYKKYKDDLRKKLNGWRNAIRKEQGIVFDFRNPS